jgi:hypothetical protein
MACKVGAVQITVGHPAGLVHSFSIQNEHAPIVTIGFTDRDEATARQLQMAAMLQNAVLVADANGKNYTDLPKE